MKIFIYEDQLDQYVAEQREFLTLKGLDTEEVERRLTQHLKYYVVVKYTKEWQDEKLNYWLELMKTPEGYWQTQEAMNQPHCEFTHYKLRTQMSYEKGNVTDVRAKAELSAKDFKQYIEHKRFRGEIIPELEIELEINTNIYKGDKTVL